MTNAKSASLRRTGTKGIESSRSRDSQGHNRVRPIATPQILILRTDAQVDEELDSALSAVPEVAPVTHYFDEIHAAADAARSYRPDIIIVELTGDMRSLAALSDELAAASPESSIVAVFQPDQMPDNVAESTVMIQALRLGVEDFVAGRFRAVTSSNFLSGGSSAVNEFRRMWAERLLSSATRGASVRARPLSTSPRR